MNSILHQQEKLNTEQYKEHILFIDSRYRTSGSCNVDYVVDFQQTTTQSGDVRSISHGVFKNVSSVELIGASIRQIPEESYVILNISELENRIHANYSMADDTFAILYFDKVVDDMCDCYTKPIKGSDMDTKRIEFNPPRASLSKLSIEFLTNKRANPNSNLSWLQENEHLYDNTLLFKITTKIF